MRPFFRSFLWKGLFLFQKPPATEHEPEGFFHKQEKTMSVEDDDFFSSIGNMYSGSYDPVEQNRALEREADKKRREQEREQARILREQQQAAQAEQQKSLRQASPQAVNIDNTKPAPVFKTDPDDPCKGLDANRRNDMLIIVLAKETTPKAPLVAPWKDWKKTTTSMAGKTGLEV